MVQAVAPMGRLATTARSITTRVGNSGSKVVRARFADAVCNASPSGIGVPAVAVPNPKSKFSVVASDYLPFLGSVPDAEFASILGAPPPSESLTYIEFEPESDARGNIES